MNSSLEQMFDFQPAMSTLATPSDIPNITMTTDYSSCEYHKSVLTFTTLRLARVVTTWVLFLLSALGNLFVLYCIFKRNRRSHVHVITMHLVLADLVFTFFSMPVDAIWNVTMQWQAGVVACKLCQVLKQFGMYVSSLMVVVIAVDRAMSISAPMASVRQQRLRTKALLTAAWTISLISTAPAAVLFGIQTFQFCQDEAAFKQCVDFVLIPQANLKPYYFFTMCISFVIPLAATVLSYSLIICEISAMQVRDQRIMGRRASKSLANIARARRKTFILTSMVTLTFVVLWGPYYGMGIFSWFYLTEAREVPPAVTMWLFILLYVNPAVHPLIYGLFMKDVRRRFQFMTQQFAEVCSSCKLSNSAQRVKRSTMVRFRNNRARGGLRSDALWQSDNSTGSSFSFRTGRRPTTGSDVIGAQLQPMGSNMTTMMASPSSRDDVTCCHMTNANHVTTYLCDDDTTSSSDINRNNRVTPQKRAKATSPLMNDDVVENGV